MKAKASRDDLQAAFDRYRVRYGKAKAEAKLTAACGVGEVAAVADDKLALGFHALAIKPAVLAALGLAPLAPSKFPPAVRGQNAQERLGEMTRVIYAKGEENSSSRI
jgi:hypothetical protein